MLRVAEKRAEAVPPRYLYADAHDNDHSLAWQIEHVFGELFDGLALVLVAGRFEVLFRPHGINNGEQARRDKAPATIGKNLSRGEQVAIYYIAKFVLAPVGALLFVDEPELFLHEGLAKRLWTRLLALRPDCVVVFVTHDAAFMSIDEETPVVWLKGVGRKDRFEYEMVERKTVGGVAPLSAGLLLSLVGLPRKLLFVEGTNDRKSKRRLDWLVYKFAYPTWEVIPVGECGAVVKRGKALFEYCPFAFNRFRRR